MSRAVRRHHRDRLKAARKNYWRGDASYSPRSLGQVLATPHPCSCSCCGNPRRLDDKPTIQERRLPTDVLSDPEAEAFDWKYDDWSHGPSFYDDLGEPW